MANVAIQGPPSTLRTGDSTNAKPKVDYMPGYVYGTVTYASEELHTTTAVGLIALNKTNWADLNESQKKDIIDSHKFIYLKFNDTQQIIEIGMHVSKCKGIETLGLQRIALGNHILPKDIQIIALNDSVYSNMIRKLASGLN